MVVVSLPALAGGLPDYAEGALAADDVQLVVEEDPFRWEIESSVVRPGVEDHITLRLVVPESHHVYRDQLAIEVLDPGILSFGALDLPPGLLLPDPADPAVEREVYPRDVLVYLPVTAPATLDAGVPVHLQLHHQGCRLGICFAPVVVERDIVVAVRPEEHAEATTLGATTEVHEAP